jgi:hypothetical protein
MTLGGVEQKLCRQKALRCAAMRQSVWNLSDYSKALQTLGQKRWWVGFGAPLSPFTVVSEWIGLRLPKMVHC